MVLATLKKILGTGNAPMHKPAAQAYDIWADTYDEQPDNLMLYLDGQLFTALLAGISLQDKQVADIGCGTGRHWPQILAQKPANLTGFDVSAGMLGRLGQKFTEANTCLISDNQFLMIPNKAFDVAVSTLTVAHIENIDEALCAWSRILKKEADLLITDFHPAALAMGGKRTFEHNKRHIAVDNFVHTVDSIAQLLNGHGFNVVKHIQKNVDESVKHYYAAKGALHVYKQFFNCPIIYGLHLKRG